MDDPQARKALDQELTADPPLPVQLHPNLAQAYRGKVARLHDALADPALREEALSILRGLNERVVIHPAEEGLQIEIVKTVELGLDAKQAALTREAACSVKVVAGARFGRCFPLTSACELERSMSAWSS